MSTTSTRQVNVKDLVIGLHVLMKYNTNWTRFENHRLSEDRKSILITLDDGREFTVSIYATDKPFDQALLCTLVEWLTSSPELKPADVHDVLVAYVDTWRNGA